MGGVSSHSYECSGVPIKSHKVHRDQCHYWLSSGSRSTRLLKLSKQKPLSICVRHSILVDNDKAMQARCLRGLNRTAVVHRHSHCQSPATRRVSIMDPTKQPPGRHLLTSACRPDQPIARLRTQSISSENSRNHQAPPASDFPLETSLGAHVAKTVCLRALFKEYCASVLTAASGACRGARVRTA